MAQCLNDTTLNPKEPGLFGQLNARGRIESTQFGKQSLVTNQLQLITEEDLVVLLLWQHKQQAHGSIFIELQQ